MAPEPAEDAVQLNRPPTSSSGLLTPTSASTHWTPQTVLSTLPALPLENSPSPLPFFHLLERLKTTKREGWRRFGIDHGESIADHMYRMSIITLLAPPSLSQKLDMAKCTRMALVHDMAESLVGDITPVDGVTKSEKSRREEETMTYLCANLLGGVDKGEQGAAIRALWKEYEDGVTLESRFVHDVDKMELLLQMVEYERSWQGRVDLGEFAWVAGRIGMEEVRGWAGEVLREREEFWRVQGRERQEEVITDEKREQMDEYYGRTNGGGEINGVK